MLNIEVKQGPKPNSPIIIPDGHKGEGEEELRDQELLLTTPTNLFWGIVHLFGPAWPG